MNTRPIERRKIFYGWYIVAAGCLIIAMTSGVISNSYSQYMKPVCADMGFSRQQMSMNQTIIAVIGMGFSLMWGKISSMINIHRFMCAAGVLIPVLYFSYSFAGDVRDFYVVSIALGIVQNFISMMIITYIVSNWFTEKRGLAVGLASMGSGIGGMIMNPVINYLITNFGWRMAYRGCAVLMFVTVVPAVFLVIREKPEAKGLRPYGDSPAGETAPRKEYHRYSLRDLVVMPIFWMLVAVSTVVVMSICVFNQTLVPHLSDCGYSAGYVTAVASISMGCLSVGKIILGRFFDKLGIRRAAAIACSCTVLGIIGSIYCKSPLAIVLILLGHALGSSFGAVCMPLIVQSIYGLDNYHSVFGKISAATALGAALAPVISGRVYDYFGSYQPIYVVAVVLAVCASALLVKFLPKTGRQ